MFRSLVSASDMEILDEELDDDEGLGFEYEEYDLYEYEGEEERYDEEE